MAASLPSSLRALLAAPPGGAQASAWADFLEEYGRLVLHAARGLGGDEDAVMDRYAYALEQLGRDDYRRLRGYVAEPRSKFTTWLVVVVRRLCLDHHRARYGRVRADADAEQAQGRVERRRLVDLIGAETELESVADHDGRSPERLVRDGELRAALAACIERLEPRDRLLLALRFEDDQSAAAIARALDFPSPFHVYRRLNRVLASLRAWLAERGVEDSVA